MPRHAFACSAQARALLVTSCSNKNTFIKNSTKNRKWRRQSITKDANIFSTFANRHSNTQLKAPAHQRMRTIVRRTKQTNTPPNYAHTYIHTSICRSIFNSGCLIDGIFLLQFVVCATFFLSFFFLQKNSFEWNT